MNRKILALLGIVAIVLAVGYVSRAPGRIPSYDAFLSRLAETEREAYCSGWAMMYAASEAEAKGLVADCRAGERPDMVRVVQLPKMDPRLHESRVRFEEIELSDEIDMDAVPSAFCAGIVRGGWNEDAGAPAEALVEVCETILERERYWPTYEPGITNQWSERWPYPGDREGGDSLAGL